MTPEDREKFFERVMLRAGRPPFVKAPAPRLSAKPREQQKTYFPVVVALPDLTKCNQ